MREELCQDVLSQVVERNNQGLALIAHNGGACATLNGEDLRWTTPAMNVLAQRLLPDLDELSREEQLHAMSVLSDSGGLRKPVLHYALKHSLLSKESKPHH